jgi:hypothetical protein
VEALNAKLDENTSHARPSYEQLPAFLVDYFHSEKNYAQVRFFMLLLAAPVYGQDEGTDLRGAAGCGPAKIQLT